MGRYNPGLQDARKGLEEGLAGKTTKKGGNHDEEIVDRVAQAFNNATNDFDRRTYLQFAADLPEAYT